MFVPSVSRSDGPTPARQSGNKGQDWEQIEIFSLKQSVANLFNRSQTFICDLWCRHVTWWPSNSSYWQWDPRWEKDLPCLFCIVSRALAHWLTANKSINQPKSGKVCLVMSSDWSRRCSHHRVVRSKSFESWKTGFKLARRDFYQSQTQYLIFDCGKERGVICVLHKISNFGGGN